MTRMKNGSIDTGRSSHSAYSWLFPCFGHVDPCYRCSPWFVTFLCPFVEKHHLVKELHFGADGILRAARKFELFVIRIHTRVRKNPCFIRVPSVAPWALVGYGLKPGFIWTIQTSEFLARQANPDLLNLRANWPADQAYR